MIQSGGSVKDVTGFVINALFGGQVNTVLVDLCLRESVRLTIRGAPGSDVLLEKAKQGDKVEVIPDGSYATFLLDLAHFNPEIYTEPLRFDPSRYEAHRAEDERVPYAFIGWGVGRHPCLGTRFAKLEITLIMAYFFALFDFELAADAGGGPTTYPVFEKAARE
ncbi:cytochrome P450 [Cryphonectria parasitica EP155]|uniref:Cytochrome P450 n=1 Tax=Cryphonectria parasitica (strain ATCC 38755 / EP155) TaxID=660469 RepID=A0A9P5CRY0_CRYP1|nr:cytochrome P450 [Cryphonectria parasitica EP155]KAF3767736.1 cytochrome P450 [Cryphonectria parasitica EP155]